MIFCPPMPPVRLSQDGPTVIGRQSTCEFPIREDDISRRHAEVSFESGQFVIRDLGSTNGTFVNGREIAGKHSLSPGDRIELGSHVLTFCRVDSNVNELAAEPDGERTVIAQRVPSTNGDAMTGNLAEIPPFAVMQILEMGCKNGILEVEDVEGLGRIWFRNGAPVHAETEKQCGFDAAMSIVKTTTGRFRFEPQAVEREHTIECSVTQLLLEGCRQLDEEGA